MPLPVQMPKPAGARDRFLRKGEFLFREGENSRAMYFLKRGVIRIFKKKGAGTVELDTIRPGQILGELAFLDGNPRSASGEALMDCELIEISTDTFVDTMGRIPEWLKILLKTLVTRLRGASSRIRQLETATFRPTDDSKKRPVGCIFLTEEDVLKASTALLLSASRNGLDGDKGIEFPSAVLQRYANQVMEVPRAKITTLLDILTQQGVIEPPRRDQKLVLKDPDFLEEAIIFLNEEHQLNSTDRIEMTNRTYQLMSLIAKSLPNSPKNPATGDAIVRIPELKDLSWAKEFERLVKMNFVAKDESKPQEGPSAIVNVQNFKSAFRLRSFVHAIAAVNERKAQFAI